MTGVAEVDGEEALAMWLADVLLPGGEGFPPASASGMDAVLIVRLREGGVLERALDAVGVPSVDSVARLEMTDPALFDTLRRIVFVTYYEQAPVLAAIRALGMPYNDAPLPAGYAPEPFDPETDAPRHGRGHWVRTEDVRPVDLSGLDHLEGLR